jgi:hypothetical protein
MKTTLILTFMLLAISSLSAREEQQDIVIKSRMDHQSSASLIMRLRTFLINNQLGDPYNQTIQTPIKIELGHVIRELPPETQQWIKELQALLNVSVLESKYSVRVDKLYYSINAFNSEVKPLTSGLNRIEYVTSNYVRGLKLGAENISFVVELRRTRSGEPIKFEIQLIGPQFLVHPDLMVDLPMQWNSQLLPDSLLVSLNSIDLSKVFDQVVKNPELIDFKVKDLAMPDVSIRVGQREVKLNKEKIKKYLTDHKNEMKIAILDLMQNRLQGKFSNIIKDAPIELFLNRALTTTGEISTVFSLKSLNANTNTRVLEARVDGQFCSERLMDDEKCRSRQVEAKVRRVIDDATFARSMSDIDVRFTEKRSNVAVSISEHYINQLIMAAVNAKLLELGGGNFRLGSEQAFVLAEEKGEGFNLYLDIINKLQGSQRVMVGRSELRFPVRFKIGLKIEKVNDSPRIQIKVLKIDTSDELLINGHAKYGLVSNVVGVRFRNKVLKAIHDDLAPFNQKILVDIDLKEFKDTYLDELSFFSDGLGRATAVLLLNGEKRLR